MTYTCTVATRVARGARAEGWQMMAAGLWRPLGDWSEDRASVERSAQSVRRMMRFAFSRLRIARHDGSYGRTYWRLEVWQA